MEHTNEQPPAFINCTRCDSTLEQNEWGGYGENSITLYPVGGCNDLIDTAFMDKEQYETYALILCHSCGHKLINWVGNSEWISPINTASHSNASKWHYGWDNRTAIGIISAVLNSLIHFGIKDAIDTYQHMIEFKRKIYKQYRERMKNN